MTKLSVPQLTAALSGGALLLAGLTISGIVWASRADGPAAAPAIATAQMGAPGTGAPGGAPPAGGPLLGAPGAGPGAAPGAPAPGAPTTSAESGLPDLEPLAPLESYRENPFVTRPPAHDEGLVLMPRLGTYVTPEDASIWGSLVRANQEYFKANLDNNFGFRFGWGSTRFPRPRTVIQPATAEPTTLFPQPPAALIAMDGVGVGQPTAEAGGPRPTGGATVAPVEPRTTVKTDAVVVRRVAAVVHDGTAVAIIEYEEAGALKRIPVRTGQEFALGTVKYRVRSIGETDVVIVNLTTNAELTVPLRGRTANE